MASFPGSPNMHIANNVKLGRALKQEVHMYMYTKLWSDWFMQVMLLHLTITSLV